MWFSQGFGGASALEYLVKVKGYSFTDAMENILRGEASTSSFLLGTKEIQTIKRLLLPQKNNSNDRVIKYLMGRGINREIINCCIDKGLFYESSPHHNCIFVGFDEGGIARFACFRACSDERIMGDASGSDKSYSFRIEGSSDTVHVFESAIDLLSFTTLSKKTKDSWKDDYLISLSGVYRPKDNLAESKVPKTLEKFLKQHKEIATIYFHLDNDYAGKTATKALMIKLKDNYVCFDEPPKFGKDLNDQLMHEINSEKGRIRL